MKTERTQIPDLLQIIGGQAHAKRAIEVAAVTGMSIVLIGPPGSGKTMLEAAYRVLAEPFTPDVVEAWPCPCGYLGDLSRACRCRPPAVFRHQARLAAAIEEYQCDVQIEVPAVAYRELRAVGSGEPLAAVRLRILRARAFGEGRPAGGGEELDLDGHRLLEVCEDRLGLSARRLASAKRVARLIADLEENPRIRAAHLAEAVQYSGIGELRR
jgi:magnesium chelatase family protein